MMDTDESLKLRADLRNRLGYHPVNGAAQAARYEGNRYAAMAFADTLVFNAEAPSRELSLALTALQEALMWGNASIACNEPSTGAPGRVRPA